MNAVVANSVFAQQLWITGELYSFDLDDTLSKGKASPAQIQARRDLRAITRAGAEAFNTMRPIEETYSDQALAMIGRSGLIRPKPNPLFKAVDREELEDPHLGISIGLPPVWEQSSGTYAADLTYMERNHRRWRRAFFKALRHFDPDGEIQAYMNKVEFEENYRTGKANVMPIPHRINFRFTGDEEGMQQYLRVQNLLEEGFKKFPRILNSTVFVDESNPPEQLSFYAMLGTATKEAVLEHSVYAAAKAMGFTERQIADTNGITAGDSMTDLGPGLKACPLMGMAHIVPAEARVAPYLFGERQGPFATTSLDATLERLDPTDELGIFRYQEGSGRPRLVVLCDYALSNPGSVTESVLEGVHMIKRYRERLAS